MEENIIVIPPFHTGTSLDEMLNSIKLLIQRNKWPIKIIGEDLRVDDSSVANAFDSESEVGNYTVMLEELFKNRQAKRILFLDFFFPGLDLYKYFIEISEMQPKLAAFMLGATFLPGDLYQWKWLEKSEETWFDIYEKVYVSSKYFYDEIPDEHKEKVEIYPWGVDASFEIIDRISTTIVGNKEYDVIFPHRLDDDKGIDEFTKIVRALPDVNFYVTSFSEPVDNKYYNQLKKISNVKFLLGEDDEMHLRSLGNSKIVLSCARQETHGYSIIKSVLMGATPILPNREVYPEYFDKKHVYDNVDEAVSMIRNFLSKEDDDNLYELQKKLRNFSFESLLINFFDL